MSYIISSVFNALHRVYEKSPSILTLAEIGQIQNKLQEKIVSKNKKEILEIITATETDYGADCTSAKEYIKNGGLDEDNSFGYQNPENERIDEGLYQVAKEFVVNNPRSKKVKFFNSSYSASASRRLSLRLIDDQLLENDDVEDVTIPFFIFNNFQEKGRISSRKSEYKQQIVLCTIHEDKENKKLIRWFGDTKYPHPMISSYVQSFYLYLFQGDTKKEYLVLSKDEIDIGQCKISGMIVRMQDQIKIGEKTVFDSKRDIVFASKVEPAIIPFTLEKTKEIVSQLNHDSLAKMLLGELRHPLWFEKLLMAILFCSLRGFDGWPIHFGILAERGTGKSSLLESINKVFDEPQELADGTTTTIKYLVPNFGGASPDEGYICKSFRVSIIDEFMRALKRNKTAGNYADNDADLITSILEHKERLAGSGKHDQKLKVRASSKVILASNPRKNVYDSIVGMTNVLDEAFMSRFLWYHQTPEHIKFIKDNENKVRCMEKSQPENNPVFVSLYDFLISFKVQIEPSRVESIFQEVNGNVPEALKGVWEGRGRHMIFALVDGVSKYNFCVQHRENPIVLDEDYEEALGFLLALVATWGGQGNIDITKIPIAKRKDYLIGKQAEIYEYICANPGITSGELQAAEVIKNVLYQVERTAETGVVIIIQEGVYRRIYPYWHHKAKDYNLIQEVTEFDSK